MKTSRSLLFVIAAIGPVLIGSSGCSKSNDSSASSNLQDAKVAVTNAAVDVKNAAVDSWDSVRDYTYDKRAEFSAHVDQMDKTMDDKMAEMRTQAPDTFSKDKQAAIKDYDDARADLRAKLSDLSNATSDTWADAKAKVAAAWQRVKSDYDKATS